MTGIEIIEYGLAAFAVGAIPAFIARGVVEFVAKAIDH